MLGISNGAAKWNTSIEMKQLLDEESIFVAVGQLFYQISKNRVALKSSFLRWCLNSCQSSEFVRWISLGSTPMRRLFIVQLDGKSVDEVTLTKVAHYIQADQLVGLNAFNVADILKAGQILGVTEVMRICSNFLARLVGQLLGNDATELTVLLKEVNCLGQFPNKTYLIALMVKARLLEIKRHLLWECSDYTGDGDQGQAPFLSHSPISWSLKDGAKRKCMFIELGTDVVPEKYVFDESEILYMMEMTSVQRGQEILHGIESYDDEGEEILGSPRTLLEEWRLSPANSVNLEEEFADMDREFLHAIYLDD